MKKHIFIRIATIVAMVLSLLGIAAVFYLGTSTSSGSVNTNISATALLPVQSPTSDAPSQINQNSTSSRSTDSQPPAKPGSRMYDAENPRAKSSRPSSNSSSIDDPDGLEDPDDFDFLDFDRREVVSSTPLTPLTIAIYTFFFAFFTAVFWLSLTFLLSTFKNLSLHTSSSQLIICSLSNLVLIIASTVILTAIMIRFRPEPSLEVSEETAKVQVDLDESNVLTPGTIDLSTKDSDLTITEAGTYTLSGSLSHSLIINAPSADVTLVLDNAEITSSTTAAIVGLAANQLTINLADGSSNTLSDGGSSDYDGAIFSNADLVFEGTGKLTVNGQQNDGEGIASESHNITFNGGTYIITASDDGINAGGDGGTLTFNDGNFYINASGDGIDSNQNAVFNGGTIFVIGSDTGGNAGIDTETGYTINGGTIVALGSDMVESPANSSKQTSLVLSLSSAIAAEVPVSLKSSDTSLISFTAPKSFRTIIISTPSLKNGDSQILTGGTDSGTLMHGLTAGLYQGGAYTGGTPLTVNNSDTFPITGIVNTFGTTRH